MASNLFVKVDYCLNSIIIVDKNRWRKADESVQQTGMKRVTIVDMVEIAKGLKRATIVDIVEIENHLILAVLIEVNQDDSVYVTAESIVD